MDQTKKKKSPSSDSFSFPSTPNPDSDFEFGSLTPDSPLAEPFTASPADHLFLNGRLQPHSFPLIFQHHPFTSRTNSTSSSTKGSLLSSRSNSTNSSCSSARTSSSDSSERRLFHNKVKNGTYSMNRSMASNQAYGCSQRWQYITPGPVLNRYGSRRRKRCMRRKKKEEEEKLENKKKVKMNVGVKLRFGRRLFRWLVMACRECHAMEPSKVQRKEV